MSHCRPIFRSTLGFSGSLRFNGLGKVPGLFPEANGRMVLM